LTKLHVYGPGVGSNVFTGQTTSFAVDARDVGCKKIDVEVVDPSGQVLDSEVSQEHGQPISVSYTPNRTGPHKVSTCVTPTLISFRPKSLSTENRHLTSASMSVTSRRREEVRFNLQTICATLNLGSKTSTSDTSSERAYPPRQLTQVINNLQNIQFVNFRQLPAKTHRCI
jgi:hypothetical protein